MVVLFVLKLLHLTLHHLVNLTIFDKCGPLETIWMLLVALGRKSLLTSDIEVPYTGMLLHVLVHVVSIKLWLVF